MSSRAMLRRRARQRVRMLLRYLHAGDGKAERRAFLRRVGL